ncbi:hypothetical protein [Pedobacter panaciterrae]
MYISMQGNWTVRVTAKNATFKQQFVVQGATSGNGTYQGTVGAADVVVTGAMWTLNIQHNPGTGFQNSDARIKFPTKVGGNYQFQIQSNDGGGDQDFDDLVLTCFTPAGYQDYLAYGHVSTYSGLCLYNPCYRSHFVIDNIFAFEKALKNPGIREVIEKYYPERIPSVIVNPNPPDPGPFKPLMINLTDDRQTPGRVADLFSIENQERAIDTRAASLKGTENISLESTLKYTKTIQLDTNVSNTLSSARRDIVGVFDNARFGCSVADGKNISLNFEEYDRTAAEKAGNPYTGSGERRNLGFAITDMNGNYIFHYKHTLTDIFDELFDYASGEDLAAQVMPDLIVSIPGSTVGAPVLYESACYFNVSRIKRIDICIPASVIPKPFNCFNGNMIGSLGNVIIGGNQNSTASFAFAAMDRNSAALDNHLHADGRISSHNVLAGLNIDCAAWAGTVDVKGCLYNTQRKANDPIIAFYTIRYSKNMSEPFSSWNYVTEGYMGYLFQGFGLDLLPKLIGSYDTIPLKVDGGPAIKVPYYLNVEAQIEAGIPWIPYDKNRLIQLNTAIYQSTAPGTVYFRMDGYDAAGNHISGATDMIAMYIDNNSLGFSLDNVWFDADGVNIVKAECNLYRIKEAYLNTPLNVTFKACETHPNSVFQDHYDLSIGKCGTSAGFEVKRLGSSLPEPSILHGDNPTNNEAHNCPGYRGTADASKFGDSNSHQITFVPLPVPTGKWLEPTESYATVSIGLTASKRTTNGYGAGANAGNYIVSAGVAIERLP